MPPWGLESIRLFERAGLDYRELLALPGADRAGGTGFGERAPLLGGGVPDREGQDCESKHGAERARQDSNL